MALLSSYTNRPIGDDTIAFGEVGLSGEVRMVTMADIRVNEAAKMGFTRVIMPKSNLRGIKKTPDGVQIIGVANMQEAAALLQ